MSRSRIYIYIYICICIYIYIYATPLLRVERSLFESGSSCRFFEPWLHGFPAARSAQKAMPGRAYECFGGEPAPDAEPEERSERWGSRFWVGMSWGNHPILSYFGGGGGGSMSMRLWPKKSVPTMALRQVEVNGNKDQHLRHTQFLLWGFLGEATHFF